MPNFLRHRGRCTPSRSLSLHRKQYKAECPSKTFEASCQCSRPPSGLNTRIILAFGNSAEKASRACTTTGLPFKGKNCLGTEVPKRVPRPAATTITVRCSPDGNILFYHAKMGRSDIIFTTASPTAAMREASSGVASTVSIIVAISPMRSSVRPRVVMAGVPRRIPEVWKENGCRKAPYSYLQ